MIALHIATFIAVGLHTLLLLLFCNSKVHLFMTIIMLCSNGNIINVLYVHCTLLCTIYYDDAQIVVQMGIIYLYIAISIGW